MRWNLWVPAALAIAATRAAAQGAGDVTGQVRDAVSGRALPGVRVSVDSGAPVVHTDRDGRYRLDALPSGWHRLEASLIKYQTAVRDSVLVRSGETTTIDFALQPQAIGLASVTVTAQGDPILDPLATPTTQRLSEAELRRLPVSSVDEAIGLSAGAVGGSYRGGRLGEQSFIIDGLGVKNQLDASTGQIGLRIPPDMLEEASLTSDAFSARYGQAISGLVNVVTRDGGSHWRGRLAHESDRPLPEGWDYGLDRFSADLDGPVFGGLTFLAALDATGRLDADPVDAPAPDDPRDPRAAAPWLLPHNSGETYDAAAKLTLPVGGHEIVRLFGVRSVEQRLLYDPAFKYDETVAPASRLTAGLTSADWRHSSDSGGAHPLLVDLHLGAFGREFVRGTLDGPAAYRLGGFTDGAFHFVGESVARAQDTVAARAPLPGFTLPDFSKQTPWGVPAFFLGQGSRGDIGWYRFRDLRGQLDLDLGLGNNASLAVGGLIAVQRVQTFSRVQGYLPVGDSVPPAVAASLSPRSAAAYAEVQTRLTDLGLTFGVRYDQFDPRATVQGGRLGARRTLSPRFAVSTVLRHATLVASWGRFSQAPDFQYLVDAAFDDTARTGRFRRGNPDLGFEEATQYAFSLRSRPTRATTLRVNVYVRRLEGLVASVPLGENPDSSIFGNTDFGTVKGAELIAERELRDWWGARVSYTLQSATATSTNAFQFFHGLTIDSITGDTIPGARVDFPLDYDRRHSLTVVLQARAPDRVRVPAGRLVAGLEGSVVVRYGSGLPFSRTNAAGDTIIGLPNGSRVPAQHSVDVLLRRPLALRGVKGGLYIDVRNLLDHRNVVALRRDTSQPTISVAGLQALAQAAYSAHPEPIPYESPRYRGWADLDHDGYVDGPAELMPLYVAAARDFTQPLFAYGPPRLVRLGVELLF